MSRLFMRHGKEHLNHSEITTTFLYPSLYRTCATNAKRKYSVEWLAIQIERCALTKAFDNKGWANIIFSASGIIPHPIFEFMVCYYLFRLYPLFCFSRSLTDKIHASSFAPRKVTLESFTAVNFGSSPASVHFDNRLARYAGRIEWSPLWCCLCYSTDVFFLTARPVQLGINSGSSTVPPTFTTDAKSVSVDVLAEVHCIFVLTQPNTASYDAFAKNLSWKCFYTTDRLPTTVLMAQISLSSTTYFRFPCFVETVLKIKSPPFRYTAFHTPSPFVTSVRSLFD